MKPGATISPAASMTSAAVAFGSEPTATMRPSLIATSPRTGRAPEPSITVPCVIRTSYLAGGDRCEAASGRPSDPITSPAIKARREERMRSEYSGQLEWSGYAGAEAVVGAGHAGSRPGNSRGTENKVRVGVNIASIDADDVGLLDEGFAVLKCEVDAILSRFDLESEFAREIRCSTLALARGDVYDLDCPSGNRARVFRSTNRPADCAVCLGGLRVQVDDWLAMTGGETEQCQRDNG